jgi:hypothetical protein
VPFVTARAYPYAEDVDAVAGGAPDELLTELDTALLAHDVRRTTALVAAYRDADGDAETLIARLTRVACSDDGTLMHNVKHLHAAVAEFRASTDPDRWSFLVAAAKWVSWYAGEDTTTYEQAVDALDIPLAERLPSRQPASV